MRRLIAPLIATLTLAAPVAAHDGAHAPTPPREVALAEEPLALPNLPVTDRHGMRGGFRDMVGGSSSVILSFSYTACESLCNVTNALLSVVDAGLEADPDADLRIVTVAIDARRDTPEALDAEAEALSASPHWLWLTGRARGTRPLLDLLRFPPGAIEDHDPVFLVGRPCHGRFTRIVGLPDPDRLIALAQAQPPCSG